MPEQRSSRRSTAGFVAAAAFVVGPALAFVGAVRPIVGFALFALGGTVALLVGLTSLVQAARGRGLSTGGGVAALAGVLFVVLAVRGHGAPAINDFTTDLDDPPAFRAAASIPENAGRDMSYPKDFAAQQRACCSDLQPAFIPGDTATAFARARQAAQSMPTWKITTADPGSGTIEAIATSRLFHFSDDIVIRVAGDHDGRSRVDMRSKSRDGKGDLGANAARIRAYMAQLAATR